MKDAEKADVMTLEMALEENAVLAIQNGKLASVLKEALTELAFQNEENGKQASEHGVANEELAYQDDEKEKSGAPETGNNAPPFQTEVKRKRTVELLNSNKEIFLQADELNKQASELKENLRKELALSNDQVKQSAQYARSLIESSLDPLVTISSEGKITDVNEAMVLATDVSREFLIGSDFTKYFTEPEKAKEIYKEAFEKGFVVDFPLTIMDGKLIDVLFNGSVYKNEKGEIVGAVIVARDITEQKKTEKELTEAKEFAELATAFAEQAQTKAEAAVKAKQQFLSNMSHEIRTPMNAIIGFTKVVLKTELTAKQKEYLMAIKMSGDAMIVLINDILDLAKVDAGKMTFEKIPFKLGISISSMLNLFKTKIQEKNLQLINEYDSEIPEILVGDPVRLHQIILNLVSNAVKFTNKGSITISVKMLAEYEEKVEIEFAIIDTGTGIAEDKIGEIFDNFQQASSNTSRLFGGTGLGLAIVKQLVEQQGGRIEVQSEIDKGTRLSFVLEFPKSKEEPEFDINIEEPETSCKNLKVLVVEDIALNQLLMKTLLEDYGFDHDMATNGRIAIEKMKQNKYDLILMDLQMPEMNGFEATDYIRNTLKSTIPIIALTADVTTVDLAKCKAIGMNDYIAKPVDDKLLYSKIINLLKKPLINIAGNPEFLEQQVGNNIRCTNLKYLNHRTKSNPQLMVELISLYLEQTPKLISTIKQSWTDKDWAMLNSAIHKMIPSFLIVGIHTDFELMAKKIQEFAISQKQMDGIYDMVLKIEDICIQACLELEQEVKNIKNNQQ